jgi:hypothetical protein
VPPADAASRARSRTGRPRKWGNRRPQAKRPDLAPEEAERRAQERREKQAREFISVRMNKAEKATIAARASAYGMGLSSFVCTVLLSDLKEPPPRTDPAALMKLAYELSKVGTNLNQLAKRANEAARIGSDKELAALMAMETELRSLTAEIAGALALVMEL